MPSQVKADVIFHLQNIADEKEGENKYKAIAFQKAVAIVKSIPDDEFEEMQEKDLLAIHGIGKSTCKAIMQIKTGEISVDAPPASVSELIMLRGVGEKTAQKLHFRYGVESIASLKKHLPIIAKDNSELAKRLDYALDLYRAQSSRIPTYRVGTSIVSLQKQLEELPNVKRISVAGSFRRGCPSIKDVDFVVSVESAKTLKKDLISLGLTIEKAGEHKITCVWEVENVTLHIDFSIAKESSFGNALNYLTGSKEFNIAIRSRALRRGFTVNEHETKHKKTGKRVPTIKEESLFRLIGVPYVPPECRIDGSEISEDLSNLVHEVNGDLHTHSAEFSRDSIITINGIITEAEKLEYKYIGISDHSRPSPSSKVEDLEFYAATIRRAAKDHKDIRVFIGLELELNKNGANKYYDIAEIEDNLDYVILATHTNPDKNVTSRLISAMESISIPKIIAHPTNRIIGVRPEASIDWDELVPVIKETDTAIEINANPTRLDAPASVIRELRKEGILFSINSDGHSVGGMNVMDFGILQARRGLLKGENLYERRKKRTKTRKLR